MLEYDKIDVPEWIDVNKTNASKECNICHYWYFLNKGFKYEQYVCNGCQFNTKSYEFQWYCHCFCQKKWLQNSFLVYEQRWCNK